MDIRDVLKKCSTDKDLYKFLYKIRTNYISNEAAIEKFSQKNVKSLSVLLKERIKLKTSSENDKIIEILLSILGNCTCFNKTAALQANESNISDTVISIVNTSDDPSLQSKGCRLIGNLAQTEKIASNLQQLGVALSLSNCIAEESNPQVLSMAIRAMRLMWNLKRFRHQILSYGTILKVVMCLYKLLKCENDDEEEEIEEDSKFVMLKRQSEPDRCISKEKLEKIIESEMELATQTNYEFMAAEKRKKVEFKVRYDDRDTLEIINGILKFILTIVTSSLPQVARSVFADGFGVKILLFLTSEVKFRSTALKILSTFAYNSTTQDFLRCSSDVVAEICDLLLKNSQTLAANEQKYALAIVCLSSESSCTRLKLRRSGIFKIMLETAATTKSDEELNLLIFAFFQFRFDEVGLEDLMRLNLVNVMIKILTDLVGKMEVDHIANDDPSTEDEKPIPRKRLNTEPLNYQYAVKYPRFDSHRPASPIGSPSSGFNQMSPSTSGYSPFNSPVRCYNDYDSDSNQYSPVCSDNEEDLDRIEAKVIEIIEKKKAEGKYEEFGVKKSEEVIYKKDLRTKDKEKVVCGSNHQIEEEFQPEEVKNDFDILDFLYNNEEIGKSDAGSSKKSKGFKNLKISSKKSSKSTIDNNMASNDVSKYIELIADCKMESNEVTKSTKLMSDDQMAANSSKFYSKEEKSSNNSSRSTKLNANDNFTSNDVIRSTKSTSNVNLLSNDVTRSTKSISDGLNASNSSNFKFNEEISSNNSSRSIKSTLNDEKASNDVTRSLKSIPDGQKSSNASNFKFSEELSSNDSSKSIKSTLNDKKASYDVTRSTKSISDGQNASSSSNFKFNNDLSRNHVTKSTKSVPGHQKASNFKFSKELSSNDVTKSSKSNYDTNSPSNDLNKSTKSSIDVLEENSLTNESLPHSIIEDSNPSELSKSKKPENFPETLEKIEEDKMQFILQLLWKVSLKYSDATAFVHSNNLKTLIKVCRLVKKPNGKIYQILQNVVEQTRNFVAIFLKQNLVFDIFGLSRTERHENCYSCDKMRMISWQLLIDFAKVGESGYGQGEIVHALMTGDLEMRKKISVKLLYVVRSPDLLNKLLFDYRALNVVLEVIFNNEELAEAACDGLTIMAENLNIKIPSDDETLTKIIPEDFKVIKIPQKSSEKIKFIVSDGEISLGKSILMESSEVFTSMLSSDFRESKFNEIHFPTYTVEGMSYFYQLLVMQKCEKLKSIAPKVKDIDTLLQSLELSYLYIISDIQAPLLNIIKIVIDETNVMKVFEWSLKNVNQDLLISSICYFLCSKVDGDKKLKLFIEANSSKYSEEWKKLIIDSISMKCRVTE